MKKISANSPVAYVLLAFISMAGLSYINFLPGMVNALAGGIGFSDVQAGRIVAFNGYGGILGSVGAVFIVNRIYWKGAIAVFFMMLVLADSSTIWLSNLWLSNLWNSHYSIMLCWRFLAGVLGGFCIGIAFSVLARLKKPERAFGMLLFIQFASGALVIYLLPGLEALLNEYAVFYIMIAFVVLSMSFLPFLPDLPIARETCSHSISVLKLFERSWLLLLSILFYQIAASAIWTYVGLIGLSVGISSESVSVYIAITGLLGLLGAILPVLLPMLGGNRFYSSLCLTAGIGMSIAAAIMLSFYRFTSIYIASMALLFFSWPVVQSYLLAATAGLDNSGRLSTIAAVVSSLGLASGPLLASFLLDHGDFTVMLYCCAIVFTLSFFSYWYKKK